MPDYTMKQLYRDKKYDEAIKYFEQKKSDGLLTEWDYSFAMKSLNKQKKYLEAVELFKQFHEAYSEIKLLNNDYGQSLYHAYIKNYDFDKDGPEKYLKGVEYVLKNCANDSQYSPVRYVVKHAIKSVFDNKISVNINYEYADWLLSFLDPLELSDEEIIIDTVDGERKGPSEREKWYLKKVHCLQATHRYDECIRIAEEALNNIKKAHNHTDYWIYWRMANSYFELGNIEKAKEIAETSMATFDSWSKYQLLTKIAIAHGDEEEAERNAGRCALFDTNHDKRVGFYYDYAEYMLNCGKEYEASLYYKLVEILRQENEWSSKKLPEGFVISDELDSMDKKAVLNKLKTLWKNNRDSGIVYIYGKIKRVLPEGKSGFITDESGTDYYFNMKDFESRHVQIQEGMHVRFSLAERIDRKKNEVKQNAVNISKID